MSDSKWYAFKIMLAQIIQNMLPDSVRKMVLYELQERVILKKPEADAASGWDWNITFEEMYDTLRDC